MRLYGRSAMLVQGQLLADNEQEKEEKMKKKRNSGRSIKLLLSLTGNRFDMCRRPTNAH